MITSTVFTESYETPTIRPHQWLTFNEDVGSHYSATSHSPNAALYVTPTPPGLHGGLGYDHSLKHDVRLWRVC